MASQAATRLVRQAYQEFVGLVGALPEARFLASMDGDRLAQPYLTRPVGRPPAEPRTWTVEMTSRAQDWSRERRVVLVIQEKPDEFLLHYFWLLTSWTEEKKDAQTLLETYRQRGTAEGHLGELMNVLHPALSSTPRPKKRLPRPEAEEASCCGEQLLHQ